MSVAVSTARLEARVSAGPYSMLDCAAGLRDAP
jgi:uncharacterized protein (DUF1778 family)